MNIAVDNMILSMPFIIIGAMLAQLAWLKGWLHAWWGKSEEQKPSRGYLLYVIGSALLFSEAADRASPGDGFWAYLLTLIVLLIVKMSIERRFATIPRE